MIMGWMICVDSADVGHLMYQQSLNRSIEQRKSKALKTASSDPIRLNITDDITLDLNGDIRARIP
jgi:hypothetical protein